MPECLSVKTVLHQYLVCMTNEHANESEIRSQPVTLMIINLKVNSCSTIWLTDQDTIDCLSHQIKMSLLISFWFVDKLATIIVVHHRCMELEATFMMNHHWTTDNYDVNPTFINGLKTSILCVYSLCKASHFAQGIFVTLCPLHTTYAKTGDFCFTISSIYTITAY